MKQTPSLPIAPLPSTPPIIESDKPGKRKRETQTVALNGQLQERLQRLSFPAFEHLTQQLLARSGFNRVNAPGRRYTRGHLTHGGLDISAYGSTDLTDSLTIVQIKQYRDSVPRRFVDELRGVMLRTGARHGLLLTTSHFSSVAETAASAEGLAPIRLIAGRELSELLIQHGLGVRQRANGRHVLDRQFFRKLEASLQRQRPPQGQPASSQLRYSSFAVPSLFNNLVGNFTLGNSTLREAADQQGGGMTWSTHVLCGVSSLWLLQPLTQVPSLAPGLDPANFALLVGVAALGALLPDLDAAESKIKHLKIGGIKPFYLPAQFVHRQLGHRGLTHSLSGLILVALLALPLIAWWGWAASAALVLGYASHLVADACTKSGIPFFYPNKYRYHLLPPGWRFTTGSQAEEVLLPFLALAVLLLLLSHLFALTTLPL